MQTSPNSHPRTPVCGSPQFTRISVHQRSNTPAVPPCRGNSAVQTETPAPGKRSTRWKCSDRNRCSHAACDSRSGDPELLLRHGLEKRCRLGAEVPGLVPLSFPRIVTVFPFLHSWTQGTGSRTGAKTDVRKRKDTPRQPRGFVEKHCVLKRSAKAERRGFEPSVPVRLLGFSISMQLHENRCSIQNDSLKSTLQSGYCQSVPTQTAHLKASRGVRGGLMQLSISGAV